MKQIDKIKRDIAEITEPLELVNNPGSMSLLSGLRKP